MAKIKPFKATRPAPDKIGLVTCRSYDDYSQAELVAWLNFNPYSFLHVLNPAYINSQKTTFDKRFKGVALKYQDFKEEKILIEESKPIFYLYEIQAKNNVFTGIVAGTSVDDYRNNIIKKHEDTLQYRVEVFKDYLKQTSFNTEPVLITYPDSTEINTFIALHKQKQPLYEFSTTKKEKHILWKIDTESEIEFLENHFENIPYLYIADGHHRSASLDVLDHENGQILSFLIAESNVKIYEFNRLIRDLNGYSSDEILKLISYNFIIKPKYQELWKPENKFEFGLYINGNFYALYYKHNTKLENNHLYALDAQILYEKILNPLLGINDLRNDERIDYISGKESLSTLKEIVDEGEYAIAFTLFPSNMNEIKHFADNDLIMPPKSTYIEPKFRSGLIIHEF
jgi:uncharacterized protein (DUF1015 family)